MRDEQNRLLKINIIIINRLLKINIKLIYIYVGTTVFGFASKMNFGHFLKIWWSYFCGYWWFSGFLVLGPCPLVGSLIFMIWIFFLRDSIFSRCLIILDLYLFSSKFLFSPVWLFVLLFCWFLLCLLSVPLSLWLPLTLVLSTLITVELSTVSVLLVTNFFESWLYVVLELFLCWCK